MAGKLQLNRCSRLMPLALLLLLALSGDSTEIFESDGPRFSTEPDELIEFSNSTGIRVNCNATGNPKPRITWMFSDGSAVSNISGLRQIEADGTLVFYPFRAEDFRQDVHAVVYRCLAFNSQGSIVSRDVQVKAAVAQTYDVYVYDTYVIKGNTAVLKCHVPGFLVKYVKIISWIQDQSSTIVNTDLSSDAKYVIDSDGNLYIRNIQIEDGRSSYQCKTNHRLTNVTRVSVTSGKLFVTEPQTNVPPRIVERKSEVIVNVDETVIIPCIGQGFPLPSTSWYKKTNDEHMQQIEQNERIRVSADALIISQVKSSDSGVYVCEISNGIGTDRMETRVLINAPLTAKIVPSKVTIEAGGSVELNCETESESQVQISWLKDSKPLSSKNLINNGQRLLVNNAQPSDRGMYQCIVKSDLHTVHGVAELLMGDQPPELIFGFEELQLQPGSSFSLLCKATGNPTPTINWTLDNIKYKGNILNNVEGNHVISWLNITKVKKEDGGVYGCSASNSAGTVSHYNRIGVYGSLMSRSMQKVLSIAGEDVSMQCPVYGYPIDSVTWEKDGELLPFNYRQKVKKAGALSISKTQKLSDKGQYICHAKNSKNEVVQAAVELVLLVSPKITPFSFQEDLVREGMRARIQCVISEGDLPLTIQWTKDGSPIPVELGITVRDLDEYSSILAIPAVTPKHNGNYKCIATNKAATVSYSAKLSVNVPPRWIIAPEDTTAVVNKSVVLNCQAEGFPKPTIKWMKNIDDGPDDLKPVKLIEGVEVLNNGSVFISKVNVNHQGYYFCFASNGISGELSRRMQLKIQAPVVFKEKHLVYKFRTGESGLLRCEAFGDSPILFSWFCNDTILDNLPARHRFKQQTFKDRESVINELHIESLERSDSGIFTCKAENSLGSDKLLVEVVIEDRPAVPEIQTILNKGNKTVEISWNKPFDGNSPIIHYILEYKRKQDSWHGRLLTLTLDPSVQSTSVRGLQAATAYEFRIAAENNIGKSDFSPLVSIVTGEEAPEGSPQQVEVDSTDPQSLRISWKPPKKSQWNGVIRGYFIGYKVYKSSESYTFISLDVPEDYGDDIIYQLSNLKQFTQYSIIVQAYNDGGRGPSSEEIVIMTSEDVPSEPPLNIRCSSLSSRSVYVIWDPPAPESTNGIIRGYKVFYKLLKDWYNGDTEVQVSDVSRLTLHGLTVNTNYSIQVVAFTKMGDGVKSQPIICKTYEDVPEAPEAIKVLPSSTDSVLVAWKGPKKPNGVITKYNVYYKPITDGEELNIDTGNGKSNINMHSLASDFKFLEVKGLQKNVRYAFWVTATSSIGEGPESEILTRATAGKIVPAKSASFNDIIKTPWKRDVQMPCKAVGQPQPQTRWISRGKTVTENERVLVRFDGSLVIKRINQEDTGNYTCRIINQYGSDEVHYSVTVIVPPGSPILEVLSKSANSVRLRWRSATDGGDPIKGYILHYKRDAGQWDKIELASDTELHTLEHLSCGATYQLFIEAFNSVGTGVPGDVVTVTTNGDAFNTPQKSSFIQESSTFATVHLDAWPSNGCPIAYFVVEYRQKISKEWILVSDHIPATQRKLVIPGLLPASWYLLRITVHTSRDDFNIAEYIFSTLTQPGGITI